MSNSEQPIFQTNELLEAMRQHVIMERVLFDHVKRSATDLPRGPLVNQRGMCIVKREEIIVPPDTSLIVTTFTKRPSVVLLDEMIEIKRSLQSEQSTHLLEELKEMSRRMAARINEAISEIYCPVIGPWEFDEADLKLKFHFDVHRQLLVVAEEVKSFLK